MCYFAVNNFESRMTNKNLCVMMRTVCAFINLALDMRIGLSVMGVNGVCRLMM